MQRMIMVPAILAALVLSLDRLDAQRAAGRAPAATPAAPGAAQTAPGATQALSGRVAVPRDTPPQTSPGQRTAMPREAALRAQATGGQSLQSWNAYVDQQLAGGGLRTRVVSRDPLLPSRTVERLQALHRGVPVWGAGMVRDSEDGVPRAIFGDAHPDLVLDTRPLVTDAAATRTMLTLMGAGAAVLEPVSLTVLPAGLIDTPRLAHTAVVAADASVMRIFVDAVTGLELLRYSEIHTQSSVGTGRGVLGDQKKLSVAQQGGRFYADDQHRPPLLTTYDFKYQLPRLIAATEGGTVTIDDIASDSDNTWTDPAVVDAHVHIGWTYDFLYKRFNRRGLDDNDRPIVVFTNALSPQAATTAPLPDSLWWLNAFWCNACGPNAVGVLFFGNGIPPEQYITQTGKTYRPFAGALDVVAHELAHGVTDSSSGLEYIFESGALNESFSDIIGTSTEFYFHGARADYVLGEDISKAVLSTARDGDRSMADPRAHGQPDHYSNRFISVTPPLVDNGGVHINSGIPNHAFYLAIEGGVNRTSNMLVQGVGAANREQIERVFYRAFVYLLPPMATFSTARAATILVARDLYGAGGPVERAVTQAWTAVGVF